MTATLTLHWNLLDHELKDQILTRACLSERLKFSTWAEMDQWIRELIQDNLKSATKGTVIIAE